MKKNEGGTYMATNGRNNKPDDKPPEKNIQDDIAATYNAFKEFEGRRYTGMKIGRGHKWHYDSGEWKEAKVTPDKWEFSYAVNKKRHGRAPEGSGVPVGTEYHWYILAHQVVRKLNANEYTTAMTGMKHKLAHKRAGTEKWSASDAAQRRHLIKILQGMIEDIQAGLEAQKQLAKAAREAAKRQAGKPAAEADKAKAVPKSPGREAA